MVCSFLTKDFIYKYTSNKGNNLTPYIIAMGGENIYFLTPHFKFIKRDKINENEILNANDISVDPFDYHVSKCGIYSFQDIHIHKIHSNYPEHTEDIK